MKSLGECSQLNYGAPEGKSDQMECVISSSLEVGSIKRISAPLVSPFNPHPLISHYDVWSSSQPAICNSSSSKRSYVSFGLLKRNHEEKPTILNSSSSKTSHVFRLLINHEEEKSSLGVDNTNFTNQFSYLYILCSTLVAWRFHWVTFEVQKFCENLVEGVVKAFKDVSKIQKKSTTTGAPVAKPSLFINEKPKAKPSLFINEKPKGKSENNLEDLKDFSDSLPIFDEYDEELIESLMDFEEKPFDYPHQGPLLDTRRPLDDGLGPIFDEEDELDPTFDEKAPSMTSINMENHLCFDPGTTPTPLTTYIQEHCEKLDLINFLSEMCVKISSQDVKHFGFDKVKEFHVSDYVFENMFNSFKVFEPDELLDQKRLQHDNGINSGFVLRFDQFLKHSKGFDYFEESFELDLQQPDFCARNSFDSFVFKENSFNLSCYRYALITGNFFASTCALDEFMVKTLLHVSKMSYDISCLESILIYNTFFDKSVDPWISNSRFEIDFLCSKSEKLAHVLNLFFSNCAVTCSDIILVYNTYFDRLHDDLKRVLHVLGKETLVSDLNKYLSCTYDPGILMFVLSVQDKQDQSPRGVNRSRDRAYNSNDIKLSGLDPLEKSFELDLQQLVFCSRKSFDSFVFKENSFSLRSYGHELITGILFASSYALEDFMVSTLLEQNSHKAETDFCGDSVLKPVHSYSESDQVRHVLEIFYGSSCFENILIYNTFFDKHAEPWIRNSQFELNLLCSKSEKLAHVLNLFFSNCAVTCSDIILVYNTYFDRLHDDLKRVLHVLGKETLVSDLNKYLSCTYDPGILMFVLSVQDKQDQSPRGVRNRSRDRVSKFEILRWKYLRKTTSKLQGSKMDLRSNLFQEGGNDVPLGSAPDKTDMHGLIIGSNKDICSLFDSYLPNHEASTHEITWRMFSTQLWSSSKKNQIKRSVSYLRA
ncbi:hypothetical protein F2Q70_00020685 [Brassica cretica]|uniref:Uncharacterized protein n=1 Tax=Brassica cretica TaxID=69181 RepID=A0A8S9GJM5_BRACR|nr:hypothetical protein F2Q70_00020685 [Brassica cretica]